MSRVLILNMDVMAGLASLADESQHVVVTSPPYYGLRDYSIPPSVWGGDPKCAHRYDPAGKRHCGGRDDQARDETRDVATGAFCELCGAWKGDLGNEPTVQLYIEHLVTVFREVRRVLRRDGTCWLNIGDSYAGAPNGNHGYGTTTLSSGGAYQARKPLGRTGKTRLKPKDMLLIPQRLIIALQDSGWWVRRDIIWFKKSCMPEAVTDRPTTAHEYVWILSKSACYYYDQWAIAEQVSPDMHARYGRAHNTHQALGQPEQRGRCGFRQNMNSGLDLKIPAGWDTGPGNHRRKRGNYPVKANPGSHAATAGIDIVLRNARSVWAINVDPFVLKMCSACRHIYKTREFRMLPKIALVPAGHTRRCGCGSVAWISHFATFPTALVERCVLAGTSERGVCPSCFAPWARIVAKGKPLEAWKKACGADPNGEYHGNALKDYAAAGAEDASRVKARILAGMREHITLGWRPTCNCDPHEPVYLASVLDPFGGSATVGLVAARLQRCATLIEINEHYCDMGRRRIEYDASLLADVEIRKGVVERGEETQTEAEAGTGTGAVLMVEQEARG